MNSEIARKRQILNDLDACLYALISTRVRLGRQLVGDKLEAGMPGVDKQREREITDHLATQIGLPSWAVARVWSAIFEAVRGDGV